MVMDDDTNFVTDNNVGKYYYPMIITTFDVFIKRWGPF